MPGKVSSTFPSGIAAVSDNARKSVFLFRPALRQLATMLAAAA
jgi:hypothetical protein